MSKCSYKHWGNKEDVIIDYKKSYENYKKYIFN